MTSAGHTYVATPRAIPARKARWVGLFAEHEEDAPRPAAHAEGANDWRRGEFVFVAHARSDLRLIKPVIDSAVLHGHAFWINPSGVAPGGAGVAEIVAAVRASSGLIAFCSRQSLGSHEFLRQIALAARFDKPVLPVMLDDTPAPDAFLYYVSLRQMLHASEPDWRYDFNRALNAMAAPFAEAAPPRVNAPREPIASALKRAAVNAGLMACAAIMAFVLMNTMGVTPTRAEVDALGSEAREFYSGVAG